MSGVTNPGNIRNTLESVLTAEKAFLRGTAEWPWVVRHSTEVPVLMSLLGTLRAETHNRDVYERCNFFALDVSRLC